MFVYMCVELGVRASKVEPSESHNGMGPDVAPGVQAQQVQPVQDDDVSPLPIITFTTYNNC